jgi:hypothetical protein
MFDPAAEGRSGVGLRLFGTGGVGVGAGVGNWTEGWVWSLFIWLVWDEGDLLSFRMFHGVVFSTFGPRTNTKLATR